MENLIALLFLARELAHRAHLKAETAAQHMWLDEFYKAIVERADAIAEAYQGQFQVRLNIPLLDGDVSAPIAETLRAHLQWIADNRYLVCPRDQTAIQNLIDEAVEKYQSTLNKLEFYK